MSSIARVSAQIDLKDNLSRPLKTAEANVKRFADRSRSDINRFSVDASKAWRKVGDEIGKLSAKAAMTGVALSASLTAPIIAAAKASVDAAAKMEAMRATFTAVIGSSSLANEQLSELEKMAGRTATSYDLLTRASAGLISGFDGDVAGANAVLESFAKLSNVMNVSRPDFDRLVTNLIQIGGQSRLTGDELRETASILPNLRSLLKDAFGTASSEELARYGITGRQALEGIMKAIDARGFKANTETYNAQVQILSTEFFKLKVAAGEALLPIARTVVRELTPAFVKLAETIRKLSPAQRSLAIGFAAAAAAAGPLLVVLGGLGGAISGVLAGGKALQPVLTAITRAVAASGGAAGVLRAALAALTGPVGIAIGLATALFVAWQKNLLGIRDVAEPYLKRIGDMFRDLYDNVSATMTDIFNSIVDTWNQIITDAKPLIDFITEYVHTQWHFTFSMIEYTMRLILDVINSTLAGIRMIWGAGWSDLSDSMKASLMRMRSFAFTILGDIAQGVLDSFKIMFGWTRNLPGVGDFFGGLLDGAQEQVNAFKAEAKAAGFLGKMYQEAADAARDLNSAAPSIFGPTNRNQRPRGSRPQAPAGGGGGGAAGFAPLNPIEADPALRERMEALKRLGEETLAIERELRLEKLRASEAALGDIISMEKFGKLYSELTEEVERAYVHRARDLQIFKKEQETLAQIAEEDKRRLEEVIGLRSQLHLAITNATLAYKKERETLHMTTEEERARWEVTNGGYREATPLAKNLYILQARLLDQARGAKAASESWKAFWTTLGREREKWVKEQREQAGERYEEYIRRITEELLELKGAQEEVLRTNLTEQFKGLAAGVRDPVEAARIVKDKVDEVIRNVNILTQMKDKIAAIREVAKSIESIFETSLDGLFENGFKSFFASVLDGFRNLAREIAAEFLKIQLMKAILYGIGQIGGSKARTDFRQGAGIPGLAVGGSAFSGQPYIVGERGPELFVPNQNGKVVRNDEGSTRGGGGTGTNITINVTTPNPRAFNKSATQIAANAFGRAARANERSRA